MKKKDVCSRLLQHIMQDRTRCYVMLDCFSVRLHGNRIRLEEILILKMYLFERRKINRTSTSAYFYLTFDVKKNCLFRVQFFHFSFYFLTMPPDI